MVAERLGICASSAYRWMKEASVASPPGAPVFARVVPAREAPRPSLVVQLGRAMIRVEAGFDAVLLRGVVAALGEST